MKTTRTSYVANGQRAHGARGSKSTRGTGLTGTGLTGDRSHRTKGSQGSKITGDMVQAHRRQDSGGYVFCFQDFSWKLSLTGRSSLLCS